MEQSSSKTFSFERKGFVTGSYGEHNFSFNVSQLSAVIFL